MTQRLRSALAFFVVVVASLAWTSASRAQGLFEGPSSAYPTVQDTPPSGANPRLAKGAVKLFDQYRSEIGNQIDIGPIWHRQVTEQTPHLQLQGMDRQPLSGEFAIGSVQTTPLKHFTIFGARRTLLRILDDKRFSWGIFHQEIGGGLRFGPIEPEVRIGFSFLSVDIFNAEPSIQLLSPRVSAGLGVHIARFRFDVKAHSEYLWRWFGPDFLVQGVTLGLRLDLEKPTYDPKSPFPVPASGGGNEGR